MAEDNTSFYFLEDEHENLEQLFKAEIKGNKVVNIRTISTSKIFDVDSIIRDPHTSQMIGYSEIHDFPEYHYFDTFMASVHADLVATFPDAEVEIVSYSKDRNRFIVKLSSREFPLEYYFYDIKAGQLAKVTSAYPTLDKSILGKVTKYQYQASDGLEITSYLSLPVKQPMNKDSKPPLIVFPHGGPEARDNMSFDWQRQFYAAHGFAVFQPNFRGSSGYGKTFAKAGYGEWGKKMQTDIDEGVEKLIKEGLVDPNNICVVGSSYGGYVAMYIATARYKAYKCSVSFAGASDLDDLFFHVSEQGGYIEYLAKSIGDRKNREELKKYSPLFLVSENTLPMLLLHGDKDTVVPMFQSKNMVKALKKNKLKGYEFIELEEEDHWLTLQSSRKTLLKESIKFINKHIE